MSGLSSLSLREQLFPIKLIIQRVLDYNKIKKKSTPATHRTHILITPIFLPYLYTYTYRLIILWWKKWIGYGTAPPHDSFSICAWPYHRRRTARQFFSHTTHCCVLGVGQSIHKYPAHTFIYAPRSKNKQTRALKK